MPSAAQRVSISTPAFAVAPASLANLVYAGGSVAGSETVDVRAFDGAAWSAWTTLTLTTIQPNRAPVVSGGAATMPGTSGNTMRVAIVHDYLNQYGGAERVLEAAPRLRLIGATLPGEAAAGRATAVMSAS